jgi:type IV pilus assembly protein PilC
MSNSYWDNRQVGTTTAAGPLDATRLEAGADALTTIESFSTAAAIEPAKEEKKSIWQFELTPKKVPRKDLMQFSRQLAVFVKAGIPLLEALNDITEETSNKHFRKILVEIQTDLRGGSTMAMAVARHREAFPPFYVGMLETAELTGHLDDVLIRLADYVERELETRRKLVSALIYPVIVCLLAIVVILVMTVFVLPKFQAFFLSLHAKLPLITRILLAITGGLGRFWFIPTGLFLLAAVLVLWGSFAESGHKARDKFLLRVPILGEVVKHAVLERFCRVLGSMVSAGVALPQAMLITAEATSNTVYRNGILTARNAMIRGEGLAAPLAATGLFPAAARQIFRVGEETGRLDEQLTLAADFFDRELDYKITKFTNFFEPAMIIVVGTLVGFVAVAMVSAMYGIYHQVKV